jgi:hypothetical protein
MVQDLLGRAWIQAPRVEGLWKCVNPLVLWQQTGIEGGGVYDLEAEDEEGTPESVTSISMTACTSNQGVLPRVAAHAYSILRTCTGRCLSGYICRWHFRVGSRVGVCWLAEYYK